MLIPVSFIFCQDSDFFCMDEFGYIIDSNHLDDDDVDEKTPPKELGTLSHSEGTDIEGLSVSETTESTIPLHETKTVLTEELQDAAVKDTEAKETSQEEPTASNVKGGSASTPWLDSSVTGWFGLNSVEEPDNFGEVEKQDKETADEASLASSVTGWLGWGEGKEAVESVETKEQDLNTVNSFTSSMTGWLGFEAKTEELVDKQPSDGEGVGIEEQEPVEKFRSRRMSLELDSSQSEEEGGGEMGTLEWLGAGLTNQLSFGQIVQETVTPASEEKSEENKEEKQQASWFQVGIGNILGYEKEANLDTESDLRDKNTEGNELEETPEDKRVSFKADISEEVVGNSDYSNESAGDKDITSAEGEDSNTQSSIGENMAGGISSVLTSLFPAESEEKEERDLLDNDGTEMNLHEDASATEQHQVENANKFSRTLEREDGGEIKPHAGETDQVYLTQSDADLPLDLNSADVHMKSTEPLTDTGVKTEKLDEIQHQTDHLSNGVSPIENNEEREDFKIDKSTTLQQPNGLAEKIKLNDPIPETTEGVAEKQNSADQDEETTIDHFDSVTVTETEEHQEESVEEGKILQVEESAQESEQPHFSENTTTPGDDGSQDFSSPLLRDGDADVSDKSDNQLPADTEAEEQEQGSLRSTLSFETETNEMKEHKEAHALDQPHVIEEHKQDEDVSPVEEDALNELKEGAGQQEPSKVTTEVVEEAIIGQRQEEERVVEEVHIEKRGKTDEVEEKGDTVGLKAEEEDGGVEEVTVEKLEEIKVIEEILWQMDGLQQEKEVVGLQEGNDTGFAKEEQEKQEPLKELKDGEDTDEKQLLNTENQKEEPDKQLKGEERSEASSGDRQTAVKSFETEEIEAAVESKTNEIQEEVTDVLNREEFRELKGEGIHEDLKEMENHQEENLEKEDEAAVPGDVDVQKSTDGAQGQSQEDTLESAPSQSDSVKSENAHGNIGEEAENKNGEGAFPEKEEVADTIEETRQEEDFEQGQRCHGELCSPPENEHNTIESAKQGQLAAEDQVLTVKTEESVGVEGGKDGRSDEEQTNAIGETDEKATGQWRLAGDRNVESSNSFPEPDAEVPSSAVNTSEDKNQSGTFSREKTEHTDYDSTINEPENNDAVFESAQNTNSIDVKGSTQTSAESQVVTHNTVAPENQPAHSVMSDGHGEDIEARQTGNAFGLFNSAFGFFSEAQSTSSLSGSDKNERSKAEASQTPEQEPEPLPDLPGATSQSLIAEPQTHSPVTPSGYPVEPDSPQPVTSSVLQSQQSSSSASIGKPLQSKTFSKDYPTLLAHVGEADLGLLLELFGRHKLQFLDYILGVSEPAAEERDHDESILTDIETLLDYHLGGQAAPSAKLAGSSQDGQKVGALLKLQDLLAKVRQSFVRGNSADRETYQKGICFPMA